MRRKDIIASCEYAVSLSQDGLRLTQTMRDLQGFPDAKGTVLAARELWNGADRAVVVDIPRSGRDAIAVEVAGRLVHVDSRDVIMRWDHMCSLLGTASSVVTVAHRQGDLSSAEVECLAELAANRERAAGIGLALRSRGWDASTVLALEVSALAQVDRIVTTLLADRQEVWDWIRQARDLGVGWFALQRIVNTEIAPWKMGGSDWDRATFVHREPRRVIALLDALENAL